MGATIYDIAIIGGGINGCGIARDAAGRGQSVFLAEKGDLGNGTSSSSTKLIHGGLRYLEHYEFRLVRESLIEREVLLRMAPHIISPLRFILPHNKDLRPVWLIRLGLFLYDHLGGRKLLPSSNYIDLTDDAAGVPLKESFKEGFEYSDCWVDDARLVVLNAVDAAERGADIRVRTEAVSATRRDGLWQIDTTDTLSGKQETIEARILVNAAGPWVARVSDECIEQTTKARIRLVKGSHIVVPGMFNHGRAYIFQNADKRIVFAIPYEQDFTLIGTTDVDFNGSPDDVAVTEDEIAYLCRAASEYFKLSVRPANVVWSYSGVRPLFNEGDGSAQEITRDYVLDLQGKQGEAPVINIYGGKITTYRCLAEEVLKKLKPYNDVQLRKWTANSSLPGGNFRVEDFASLTREAEDKYPSLEKELVQRLLRAYGTRTNDILANVTDTKSMGQHFGAGLYQREVEYLVRKEWAVSAEDILWRRTKLGLRIDEKGIRFLEEWMKDKLPSRVHSVA